MCMNKINFENHSINASKKIEGNLRLIQNKKTISWNVTQLKLAIISSYEVEILSSTPR
jgi:hypothetical protein